MKLQIGKIGMAEIALVIHVDDNIVSAVCHCRELCLSVLENSCEWSWRCDAVGWVVSEPQREYPWWAVVGGRLGGRRQRSAQTSTKYQSRATTGE